MKLIISNKTPQELEAKGYVTPFSFFAEIT